MKKARCRRCVELPVAMAWLRGSETMAGELSIFTNRIVKTRAHSLSPVSFKTVMTPKSKVSRGASFTGGSGWHSAYCGINQIEAICMLLSAKSRII